MKFIKYKHFMLGWATCTFIITLSGFFIGEISSYFTLVVGVIEILCIGLWIQLITNEEKGE